MGNHMSCLSPAALQRQIHSDGSIKFIHSDTGAISELAAPLTAAEVMMEFPAQFLCCFSSAMSNGRPVTADEELRPIELYILFPMHKLNTRFSMEDMAALAAVVSQGSNGGKQPRKGAMSQSKVAPLPVSRICGMTQSASIGSLATKQMDVSMKLEGFSALMDMGSCRHNMKCRAKSWTPKLETIRETKAAL